MFRARTPPEAIDLVSRLLEYTPSSRISPLQACAHNFFDELREGNTRLPNGRPLPPLFNFTETGIPNIYDLLKENNVFYKMDSLLNIITFTSEDLFVVEKNKYLLFLEIKFVMRLLPEIF